MYRKFVIQCLLVTGLTLIAFDNYSQTVIPLYNGPIPNGIALPDEEIKTVSNTGYVRYEKVSRPTLEIYLPAKEKVTGAAVIIIPGGAYITLSYTSEGPEIAAEFVKMGIAAFVLKYRLPSDKIMLDKTIGPLQDVQQALKTVRSRAKEWNIDTQKVGIIGFSAGGHLAASAGTHFTTPVIESREHISLRPDFMILVYPVISFADSITHKGSKDRLIGLSPPAALVALYSNETQVTPQTPPTILIHSADDKTVKVENSLRFFEALLKNKVSAEMHIYPTGGHGYGITSKACPDHWTDRVQHWLEALAFIKK